MSLKNMPMQAYGRTRARLLSKSPGWNRVAAAVSGIA